MIVKLLTEHHLAFLILKGGRTGWPESTHVKIPHCWKSHVTAHIIIVQGFRVVEAYECWHKSLTPLMEEVRSMMGDGPVYISFDIDGLDPAFAPGTGMIKLIFHRREVSEEGNPQQNHCLAAS